jgi:ribosomal protein L32
MLALLSRRAARLLDVRLETPEGLSPSEENGEALVSHTICHRRFADPKREIASLLT